MAGFLTSVIEEFITGKGTLQQIGLLTPNPALFTFLLAFFGGLTAYATARTIYRATNKEMTAKYALQSTPLYSLSLLISLPRDTGWRAHSPALQLICHACTLM